MQVDVTGLSITCDATWNFTFPSLWHQAEGQGTAHLTLSPTSTAHAHIQLHPDQDGLVSNVSLVIEPGLVFPPTGGVVVTGASSSIDGEILVGILELVADVLPKVPGFADQLNEGLSSAISPPLSQLLTQAFHTVNTLTRPYIHQRTHIPPRNMTPPTYPGPSRPLVDFTTSKLLHVLDYLLNVVVGADGPLGINTLIDRFVLHREHHPHQPHHHHQYQRQPPADGVVHIDSHDLVHVMDALPGWRDHPLLSLLGITVSADEDTGLSLSIPIGPVNLTLGITNMSIDGLDTWDHIHLLTPYNPQTLLLQTGLDTLNISISFWVSVSVPSPIVNASADVLTEHGTFHLDLSDNLLQAYMQASLDASQMENVHLNSILLGGIPCLASGLLNATFPAILFNTTITRFALQAVSSNGTNNNTSTSLEEEIDEAITHLAALFTESFGPAIPALFNGLVDGPARTVLDSIVQLLVNESMNTKEYGTHRDAHLVHHTDIDTSTPSSWLHDPVPYDSVPQACPAPSSEPFGIQHEDTAVAFGVFTLTWLLICGGLIWYGNVTTPLSRMRKMSSQTNISIIPPTPTESTKHAIIEHVHVTPTSNVYDYHASPTATVAAAAGVTPLLLPIDSPRVSGSGSTGNSKLVPIKGSGPSLAFAPGVSLWLRYGIPFLICLNIAQFISSNTGIGAGVSVRFAWPDHTEWLYNVFEFLLTGTVHDMWVAGVYPLSLLILIFSGMWPYMKLILLLACWVVRPTGYGILSVKWRHRCLSLLDSYGKYSLIDAYVMTLMMVAFRLSIPMPEQPSQQQQQSSHHMFATNESSGNDTIPYEPAAVDVFVLPEWGIYSFILATIFSLILTHIVAHIHRVGQNRGTALDHKKEQDVRAQQANKQRIALMTIGDPKKQHWVTSTWWGRASIAFMLVLSLCMVFGGAVIISFTFQFEGLVSLALNGHTEKSYSLYSIVPALFPASAHPNFGVVYIQIVYLLFSFIVPCTHIMLLLAIWVAPLTLRTQYKLYVWCETLNAWSALEVFVLSVIASVAEIRQFAAFMVGSNCDPLQPIMSALGPDVLNGSDKCFDVVATLNRGCWVLFSACAFYIVARNIVMNMSHTSIRRRAKLKIGGPAWATPQAETARSYLTPATGLEAPSPIHHTHMRSTTPTPIPSYVPPHVRTPSQSRTAARGSPSPNHQSPSLQHRTLEPTTHS